MKSMCQEARRNSPSVALCRPTSCCIWTTPRIASSSIARSCSAEIWPPANWSRASSSFCGRSRLPTWSARNGGVVRRPAVAPALAVCASVIWTCLGRGSREVDLDACPVGVIEEELARAAAGDLVADRLHPDRRQTALERLVVGGSERDMIDRTRPARGARHVEPERLYVRAVGGAVGDVPAWPLARVEPEAVECKRRPVAGPHAERPFVEVA